MKNEKLVNDLIEAARQLGKFQGEWGEMDKSPALTSAVEVAKKAVMDQMPESQAVCPKCGSALLTSLVGRICPICGLFTSEMDQTESPVKDFHGHKVVDEQEEDNFHESQWRDEQKRLSAGLQEVLRLRP